VREAKKKQKKIGKKSSKNLVDSSMMMHGPFMFEAWHGEKNGCHLLL